MNMPRVMDLQNILNEEGSCKPRSPSSGQKRKRDNFACTPPRHNKNPKSSVRRVSSRSLSSEAKVHQARQRKICATPPGSLSSPAKSHQARQRKIYAGTPPMSSLVSRLRRQVEENTQNAIGPKPSMSIMDWILDSMSPYMDYPEDDLLEIAEKSEDLRKLRSRVYTWDEFSLSRYWYDQALVWNRVPVAVGGVSNNAQRMVGHPESFVRSTAGWDGDEARAFVAQ